MKRTRHQTGSIYEASGRFYVRFRQVELRDGKPVRVQRSEYLCDRDSVHDSAGSRAVKNLRDQFMVKINAPKSPRVEMTVADFWNGVYLPFAERNLRAATVYSYKQIWRQHLESHFGFTRMRDYITPDCSRYLTALAEQGYGRNSLNHIRGLASSIFSHALNLGYCAANPIRGAKPLAKVKEAAATPHYTREEADKIIGVQERQGAALFALCFYAGLRPSEAVALQWSDLSNDSLNVRRACVRGIVGDCKNKGSRRSVPVIKQVRELLAAWRVICPDSHEKWVFAEQDGSLINLAALLKVMRARCGEKGLEWKGLYAGRRGCATLLVELTGNLIAAQECLGHATLVTTATFYKKMTSNALSAGMAAMEAAR